MESMDKKAIKSGIWYTVSSFLTRGIGIITTPIFTRLLSQEEYGLYNQYSSWVSIFAIIFTLNLEASLISARFDYEKEFDKYCLSILSLGFISVSIWMLLFNLFSPFAVSVLKLDIRYINAMFVYLLFYPAVNLFQIKERFSYKYKTTVLIGIITSLGSSLISVLLVLFLDNKLDGRIFGHISIFCILGCIIYIYFIVQGKHFTSKYWLYALKICLPYIPHLLSLTVLSSTDRIMITNICGSTDTALYSLAYNCGMMIAMFIGSMNNAMAPWIGDKIHSGEYDKIRRTSYAYILSFVYIAVGFILIAPEILLFLGGESYKTAVNVVPPVVISCVCQLVYLLFVNVEQFSKKTVGMAIGSTCAAVINYVLNLIFIPRYGFIAAAYTTFAGYLFLVIIHMYLVRKIRLQNVFDYNFMCILFFSLTLLTSFVWHIYSQTFLRYILVALYSIAGILLFIRHFSVIRSFLKF